MSVAGGIGPMKFDGILYLLKSVMYIKNLLYLCSIIKNVGEQGALARWSLMAFFIY